MKRAQMTVGPWSGLRIYDEAGNIILHHDANARTALIERAIDFLRTSTEESTGHVVYEIDGETYELPGGLQPALQILKAVVERG